jgi:WD40 repeat protein
MESTYKYKSISNYSRTSFTWMGFKINEVFIFYLNYLFKNNLFRCSFSIDNAHPPYVRDIDYNPNRQYHLMTCGDDCRVKFWDVRKPNECLKILTDHSHWLV